MIQGSGSASQSRQGRDFVAEAAAREEYHRAGVEKLNEAFVLSWFTGAPFMADLPRGDT